MFCWSCLCTADILVVHKGVPQAGSLLGPFLCSMCVHPPRPSGLSGLNGGLNKWVGTWLSPFHIWRKHLSHITRPAHPFWRRLMRVSEPGDLAHESSLQICVRWMTCLSSKSEGSSEFDSNRLLPVALKELQWSLLAMLYHTCTEQLDLLLSIENEWDPSI